MKGNIFTELRLNYKVNGSPLSQRKLAEVIGIPASHISRIENGKRPSLAEYKAYHTFFKVSYEYLLGETPSYTITDIYRQQSSMENKVQSTIQWLNETQQPDEIEIKNTVNMLLGEEKGLLLLFYLTNVLNKNETPERLINCLKHINENKYVDMPYNMLRMHFD